MQTIVAMALVVFCVGVLLRGVWKQLAGRGRSGCAGCGGGSSCGQANGNACNAPRRDPQAPATVQWVPRSRS